MRLHLLAAALLTLLAAGTAAAREKSKEGLVETETFGRVNEEYQGILKEYRANTRIISGYTDELRTVQDEYEAKGLTDELAARRNKLRAEVAPHVQNFFRIKERFSEIERRMKTEATFQATAGLSAGELPDVPLGLSSLLDLENRRKELYSFQSGTITGIFFKEEAVFSEAVKRRRKQALLRRLIAGLAVAIAAGLAFLWRSKRRAAEKLAAAVPAPAPAQPAAPALPPSASVMPELLDGNFRVGREIGRGGMGLVFAAVDETLRRKVAIKRMKKEVIENRRELEMFLQEARLVAALKHPNLVEIHSIVREQGQLYLVFEYVDGRPLHHLIEREERLSHERTLKLLRQVAEGLDYAHSRKVIHRDLKPANIMVGEDDAVKIMDFGLAHQAKKTVAKMTQAAAWGTPPYMSPEQELGTVSRESDIYSLGALYYEMITGEPVFTGPDFLKQKRELDYVPPSKAAAGLPAGADAVVRRCLDPDAQKRFHSGAEFIAAASVV
ncbi:MAG: serine/threonine-protein kinase [Elusimicrobiota bacterium]